MGTQLARGSCSSEHASKTSVSTTVASVLSYTRRASPTFRPAGGVVSSVPDSDTRSRLKCAPTLTPKGSLTQSNRCSASQAARPPLELFDAPSRRQGRGAYACRIGAISSRAARSCGAISARHAVSLHDRGRPHRPACEYQDGFTRRGKTEHAPASLARFSLPANRPSGGLPNTRPGIPAKTILLQRSCTW